MTTENFGQQGLHFNFLESTSVPDQFHEFTKCVGSQGGSKILQNVFRPADLVYPHAIGYCKMPAKMKEELKHNHLETNHLKL